MVGPINGVCSSQGVASATGTCGSGSGSGSGSGGEGRFKNCRIANMVANICEKCRERYRFAGNSKICE